MIVKLKKISLKGPKEDFAQIIDALKGTGVFEQSNFKKLNRELTEKDFAKRDELTTRIARIQSVLEYIGKVPQEFALAMKEHKKFKNKLESKEQIVQAYENKSIKNMLEILDLEYDEFKSVYPQRREVMQTVAKLEKYSTRTYEIKTGLKRNAAMIKEFLPYKNMDISFNTLNDTENAFMVAGIIKKTEYERFLNNTDIENIIVQTYEADYGRLCVVAVGHMDDYSILNSIFDYGFERCKFNYAETAKEKLAEIEEQNILFHYENLDILYNSLREAEEIRLLKMYYDYLISELNTEDVLDNTLQTESHFILNGWIVAKEQSAIEALIKKTSPQTVIRFDDIYEADSTPTLVKNSKIIDPYASITNLYSTPGQKDLDPNPFVAFFYFLFFGLMIGDIGYGIIMFAATLFVLLKFKPKGKGTKDLIMIICMGGVSAMIWGLLFGSVFGFTSSDTTALAILPRVFDPINDSLMFMGFCLGLGVLHLMFGLFLKVYNSMRQKKWKDAFDAIFRITFFVGLILVVLSLLEVANLQMVGICVAASGVLLTILTKGIGGLFSFVNYLSDILSYTRLFGLCLVGAVIAMVANIMGGMLFSLGFFGVVAGIVIALMFHIFNLAIGLLSAYVHNARLQFVEFFGKFYEGGGREFAPLGSGLKYVRIKSTLLKKEGESK